MDRRVLAFLALVVLAVAMAIALRPDRDAARGVAPAAVAPAGADAPPEGGPVAAAAGSGPRLVVRIGGEEVDPASLAPDRPPFATLPTYALTDDMISHVSRESGSPRLVFVDGSETAFTAAVEGNLPQETRLRLSYAREGDG